MGELTKLEELARKNRVKVVDTQPRQIYDTIDFYILSGQIPDYNPREDYKQAVEKLTEGIMRRGIMNIVWTIFNVDKIKRELDDIIETSQERVFDDIVEYVSGEGEDLDPYIGLYVSSALFIDRFREAYNQSPLVNRLGKEGGEACAQILRSAFYRLYQSENGPKNIRDILLEIKRLNSALENNLNIEDTLYGKSVPATQQKRYDLAA